MWLEVSYILPKSGSSPEWYGVAKKHGNIDSQSMYFLIESLCSELRASLPDKMLFLNKAGDSEKDFCPNDVGDMRFFALADRIGFIGYGQDSCALLERYGGKLRTMLQNKLQQPVVERRVGGNISVFRRAGDVKYNLQQFIPANIPESVKGIDWRKNPKDYDDAFVSELSKMIRSEIVRQHEDCIMPKISERMAKIIENEIKNIKISIVGRSKRASIDNALYYDSYLESKKILPYWLNIIISSNFQMNYPLTIGRYCALGYGYMNYTESLRIARNNEVFY